MQKKITGFGFISLILLGFAFVISSCSPNSTTPEIPLKSDEMDATISGFGTFDALNTQVANNSLYDIRGSLDNDSLVVEITVSKQILVPYTIDVSADDFSSITYSVDPNGFGKTYAASKLNSGSSGQIKITSTSPNLEGTFSGTLVLIGGSEIVTITNGAFNATYK